MIRAAAILAWISGLGFGIPAVIGVRYFAEHDQIWTFLGFPTYGGGPFDSWGIPTSVALMSGFIAVCAAEVVIGFLLWTGNTIGLWAALALLTFEFFYWIGFALPFGPILGLTRTALVVIAIAR